MCTNSLRVARCFPEKSKWCLIEQASGLAIYELTFSYFTVFVYTSHMLLLKCTPLSAQLNRHVAGSLCGQFRYLCLPDNSTSHVYVYPVLVSIAIHVVTLVTSFIRGSTLSSSHPTST